MGNEKELLIPIELVTDKKWGNISSEEIILYSLILNRIKNQMDDGHPFIDEDGVFTIYRQEEIAEQLHKSLMTIKRGFKKLKLLNLIKTKPQGLGLPQKIYLYDTYFLSKIKEM